MERKLHTLNRTDRRLLRLLQQDARTSYAELARQVGLSTTPCRRFSIRIFSTPGWWFSCRYA